MRQYTRRNANYKILMIVLTILLTVSGIVYSPRHASSDENNTNDISQSINGLTQEIQKLTDGKARISTDAETGLVSFIGTDLTNAISTPAALGSNGTPEQAARSFLSGYGRLFGISDQANELVMMESNTVDNSRSFTRFQQVYEDIPILGGELIVQVDSNNNIISASSDILPKISLDVTPIITSATAQEAALGIIAKAYGLDTNMLTATEPQLWIYNPIILGIDRNITSLVWRIEVASTDGALVDELVLVDAQLGFIALHFNQIETAKHRHIHTAKVGLLACGDIIPGSLLRDEGGDPTGFTDADNAYEYTGYTYDYYLSEHGRDSIDNAGMTIVSTVDYDPDGGCDYGNAFWNGVQMVFGTGFTSALDVVAHELTHGVTDYESNLFYYMQSGAISEGFSDIWGEFVELTYNPGAPSERWLIGEDLPIGALRNMQDPTISPNISLQPNQPDKMTSPYFFCCPDDNGGVHINSGIANKAAYLMVDGATFNGYVVTGIGISKVADLFYEVQTNLLTSTSDYADLYYALQQAAINLGFNASEQLTVQKAIDATEMDHQPTSCLGSEAPPLDSGVPYDLFFDDMENPASGNWSPGGDFVGWAITDAFDWWYGGNNSLWGIDYGDTASYFVAMTSNVTLPAGRQYYLHFRNEYSFESPNYDGGVVEYSTNGGGSWNDAGSLFINNGYTGTVSTGFSNPLGGQAAFVGYSCGYNSSSRLDLSSLAGQTVKFRFRIGTDSLGSDWGWFIDDVRIYSDTNYMINIPVNPTSGLITTEAGGTATFTIKLNTQPTANVVVNLSSNDTTEGTVSPASVTFTTANWNTPRTVTVTGVNDFVMDGNVSYTIVTAAASSADPDYNNLNAADVSVTNTDDDVTGITVNPTSELVTTEAGGTATFTIVLNTSPTADVTIGLSSSDLTEGTVSPASLTFSTANWSTPRTVTATGVDDALIDGDIAYTIITSAATSTDPSYNGLNAADVSTTNNDNEPGIRIAPTSGLVTTESGGTDSFTIVLNSLPTADVTIGLSSSDLTEGTVSPASLTFSTANWSTPRTVTATGVNDTELDGDIAYTIVTAAATSADPNYNGVNAADVRATNQDNDAAGITVDPTSGLVTTESGGAVTFTIVLDTQPTASVSIGLNSSDLTEGTVSPASVTFSTVNWSTPRTVTVTGVDDAVVDGDIAYTIITAAATSADPNYNGLNADDVSVTNKDTPGITVNPTSGLVTTEAGGTDTFTIVLNAQPTADVTIDVSSSNHDEGVVDGESWLLPWGWLPASVTFTASNWNIPRTFTVTGIDDLVMDGDTAYIITTTATSTDPDYNGMSGADVSVTNTDDDVAGITVNPTSGLVTTEYFESATFTIVLNSQPTANVTIGLSSSDLTEGVVELPASVTFTVSDWNTPQTVTVQGVDDDMVDGDIAYTIVTASATSTDPDYNGLNPADVRAINIDKNVAVIIVYPTSGLITTEAGVTDTFTIVLNTSPTANVTIGLSSSDLTEGTVSPASLTFSSANWSAPRTVTVTGVDDTELDGAIAYTIVTDPAISADPNYNTLNADDVSVTNKDVPGFTVYPTSGLITTEAGGTDTFTIALNNQSTADVTIGLSSSDPTEGNVSPASLTFSSANWSTPQTVTVTGVDDADLDGDIAYTIVTAAATSADPNYDTLNADNVKVTNTDDEAAGIIVNPTSGLVTTEAGGTDTFTIALGTQPTASVTIGLSSSDTTEGTVSLASVTFSTANWSTPQTVTVTGVNDFEVDGDIIYTIVTAPATSADHYYNTLNAANVRATNRDNDVAGITVNPPSGLVTTEAGGTATFTIVLNSQPTADVTIGLSSGDTTEGTVSPASVTFSAASWNISRTVTVTGVNDFVMDGNIAYTIVTAPATSADPNYTILAAADVSVTNTDNDAAGITVDPSSGLVTTEAGGTDAFTIVLNSQPAASVTIGLSSSDLTEGTVSPASLTFTTFNWNTPRTVTVTGVDDFVMDGDISYTIVTAPATSADPNYNGFNAADVSVTNTDNDTPGIIINPTSGLVTTEAGGTDSFTIVLNSLPTASVTIGLGSSDTFEGTVSPASVTFTTSNWNTPQTVTVTGVDDALMDSDISYTIVTDPAASADTNYDGLNAADVGVTNTDNDTPGITVNPTSGLVTTEAGGTDSFTIVLNNLPTASVTIGLSSSDTSEGTVSPASLTFTIANWDTPQTVTVTGVDDALVDSDIAYTIITAAASSADTNYDGLNASDVSVTNTNDDPGITVNPTSGLITTEAGGTDTFTIVLNSLPTASVTIGLSSSDLTEGTVSPASVMFNPVNWGTPQTVTVTGVDDTESDGDIAYTIMTAPATSADPNYNTWNASDVSVINRASGGGGGGGGGGGSGGSSTKNWEICVLGRCDTGEVNSLGTALDSFWVGSLDKQVILYIPVHTKMKDASGKRLDGIWINTSDSIPDPPPGYKVFTAYDFEPDGATFDPAIRVTMKFNPDELYAGQTVVAVYYYDEAAGAWQFIEDSLIENITGEDSQAVFTIGHFTQFAVMTTEVISTPMPIVAPTTPATSGGLGTVAWTIIGIAILIIVATIILFFRRNIVGGKPQDTDKK